MMNSEKKQRMPAITGVAAQPTAMPPTCLQRICRTPRMPFTAAMPITAPTMAWELETGMSGMGGRPRLSRKCWSATEEKRKSTTAWETTETNAPTGVSGRMPLPTVIITGFEKVTTPTPMAMAPRKKSCWTPLTARPATWKSLKGDEDRNTPITLPMLLAPRLYEPRIPATMRPQRV
jgi:hypothetical protein